MSVCSSAGILGTGHYAPERLLTNFDLEKLVDTTDEWIRTRTGVETRHLAAASFTFFSKEHLKYIGFVCKSRLESFRSCRSYCRGYRFCDGGDSFTGLCGTVDCLSCAG